MLIYRVYLTGDMAGVIEEIEAINKEPPEESDLIWLLFYSDTYEPVPDDDENQHVYINKQSAVLHSEQVKQKRERPFFHLLDADKRKDLPESNRSVGWMMENYAQPVWCTYPEALASYMGCSSLIAGYASAEYCKACELYKASGTNV